MTDAVIGAIINYGIKEIEPWVVSLERSGFEGHKIMICYDNIGVETRQYLLRKNFEIWSEDLHNQNICVDRFRVIEKNIESYRLDYDFIVTTDVKDVIFQSDPTKNIRAPIVLSSEGIRYQDEPWGHHNFIRSFTEELYQRRAMYNRTIFNAGVLAGYQRDIMNLAGNIYQMCAYRPPYIEGGGGPDQAALNLLVSMYSEHFTTSIDTDAWVCQAGTTADPDKIERFRDHLLVKEPHIIASGLVRNFEDKPYSIVHQYDRNPLWKTLIDRKFRE